MSTEQTTTTTIPGVTQATRCCWVVIDPATDKPREGEEVPHFDSERDAKDWSDAESEARQLDTPCWTAISACDEVFEADGMHLHFPTIEMAQRDLDACGWAVMDGRLCCEDCGEVCGL